jgi:hypothetical protein
MTTEKNSFVDKLCDILVKQGALKKDEAKVAKKKFANRSKDAFDNFLTSEGLVTKEQLLKALSEYFQVPSMDVIGYFFDHDLVRNFPKNFLIQNAIVPVEVDQDILTVVASDPSLPNLVEKIGQYTSYEIEFLVGEKRDIFDVITEYYDRAPESYINDLNDPDEVEDDMIREGVDVNQLLDDDEKTNKIGE